MTLLELLAVMAVIAILALVAAPRFMEQGGVRVEAAAKRLAADIRYAQRLAVTKHMPCGVAAAGATYLVFENSEATPAFDPLTKGEFVVEVASDFPGVAVSGGPVLFDARGRPSSAATFSVGGKSVEVEAETGLVCVR